MNEIMPIPPSCVDGHDSTWQRRRTTTTSSRHRRRHPTSCGRSNTKNSSSSSSSRLPIIFAILMLTSWRRMIWSIVTSALLLAPGCFEKGIASSSWSVWLSWLRHHEHCFAAMVVAADALMIPQQHVNVNVVVGITRGEGQTNASRTTSSSSSTLLFGSTHSYGNHGNKDKRRIFNNGMIALALPFFRKNNKVESNHRHHHHHHQDANNAMSSTSSSSSQSLLLSRNNNNRHHQEGWPWKMMMMWKRKHHHHHPQPNDDVARKHRRYRHHKKQRRDGELGCYCNGPLTPSSSSSLSTAVAILHHYSDYDQQQQQGKGIPRRRNTSGGVARIRRLILLPSMFMLSSAMTPLRRRLSHFGTASTATTTQKTKTRRKMKGSMAVDRISSSSQYRQDDLLPWYGPHPPPPLMQQLRRHVTNAASSANTNAVASLFSRAAKEVALSFRGGEGSSSSSGREVQLLLATVAEKQQQQQQVKREKKEEIAILEKCDETTFIVETQLFPIVIPRTFQPPTTKTTTATTTTTTTTSSRFEISVASVTSPCTTATSATAISSLDKPPMHLLHAVSQPLLPKKMVIYYDGSSRGGESRSGGASGFTGRELFYPETIDALVKTGLKISLLPSSSSSETHVDWVGERNTDKFLKDHRQYLHDHHRHHQGEWYKALHSSQEVLVWVGKFSIRRGGSSGVEEYYGAELPIIKTTSIVHQSPKYLAELLMDSSRVRMYNKMSLGRTDIQVLQTGV